MPASCSNNKRIWKIWMYFILPRYNTSDNRCVDSCDYENFKYLLKDENGRICYNYIPENYFIYIGNYNEKYPNTDEPIIKLGKECPNESYDSSFNNRFCINSEEDIFHFIKIPNDLITYNIPLVKKLWSKNMVIRAFNSGQKMKYIDNDYDKLIQIDVSPCEKKLKEMNEISDEESLIIQDVFNYENEEYFFRVFTKEGRELPFCDKNEDIIIKYFKYKIDKPENASSCPEDFPYLLVQTNQCL